MVPGDDAGLRVPPRLAEVQVVVLVVKDDDDHTVTEAARRIQRELLAAGVRSRLDDQVSTAFGRRATDWELKGVPIRVEVGPRDLLDGMAVLRRRDSDEKLPVSIDALAATVVHQLDEIQAGLHSAALAERVDRTVDCVSVDEVAAAASEGFARIAWSLLDPAALDRLGRDALSVRCVQTPDGEVPATLDEPENMAIVARAY